MMTTTIGKCGLCGGPVVVPTVWYGVVPPTPTCKQCGATHQEKDKMPTLPMRPASRPAVEKAREWKQ